MRNKEIDIFLRQTRFFDNVFCGFPHLTDCKFEYFAAIHNEFFILIKMFSTATVCTKFK